MATNTALAGGRETLAAAPADVSEVPEHLRIEQALGWGWPTAGGSLALGAASLAAMPFINHRPFDMGIGAICAGMLVIGAGLVALHLRAVKRRVVLVPTDRGAAIYRGGRRIAEATRNQLTPYAHSVFQTVYLLAMLGVAVFLCVMVGRKEPGVILAILPIIAILVSNMRSRLMYTHIFVLRGETTKMFRNAHFARAFGDSQRWA